MFLLAWVRDSRVSCCLGCSCCSWILLSGMGLMGVGAFAPVSSVEYPGWDGCSWDGVFGEEDEHEEGESGNSEESEEGGSAMMFAYPRSLMIHLWL